MNLTIDMLDIPSAAAGSAPVWDDRDDSFFQVDRERMEVLRLRADGRLDTWQFNGKPGSLALTDDRDTVVLVMASGIFRFDLVSGQRMVMTDPESSRETRCDYNDSAVDPEGRLFVGTASRTPTDKVPMAGLYRIEPNGIYSRVDGGHLLGNGLCWSPDQLTMYHVDTLASLIHAYDYEQESGKLANRRVFADLTRSIGVPAGAAVDVDGCVWTAICEGGKLARYTPTGTVDFVINLPVRMVSGVTFGGPDLSSLFVTSIGRVPLGGAPEPDMGRTFVIEGTGTSSMPLHTFPIF